MFVTVEKKEEDIKKSLCQIMKSLKSMELFWTTGQEQELKRRVKENMRNKQRAKAYGDLILKRCKQHNGPITNLKELQTFVKKTPKEDLRKNLRNEIIFQRVMHPIDAKERNHLYKENDTTPRKPNNPARAAW